MLHTILKESTKSFHSQLEQLMYVDEIINNTLTLTQYKQLLTTNYLVNNACEEFLFTALSASMAAELNIKKRSKTSALLADMEELEMLIPEKINADHRIIIPKNNAAILGALYVLEGATLGGNVIQKKLATNACLIHLHLNFNYYQIYGSSLIKNWKEFCDILNLQPPESYTSSIDAAQQMFKYFILVQQQIVKA